MKYKCLKDITQNDNIVKQKNNVIKVIMICISFVFAIPSIVYLLKGNSICNFHNSFNWLLQDNLGKEGKIINTICFFLLFSLFSFFYFIVIRKHKELFESRKQIFRFIAIIAFIFLFVLPLTSTDIFYYMGTGWSEACYKVNPYETSVEQVIETNAPEDEMLNITPDVWKNQTVVYGPLWPVICKILTILSLGKVTICLFIFKVVNLLLHLLNCYLISKTTNRKIFVLMYGLNPLVLFEAISNVHNDIFMISLILLAIYFVLKKKKIWPGVIALALAASIKYFTILLLPFLLLYHYRKQKILPTIVKSIGFGIITIFIVAGFYLLYMDSITEFFDGILLQQTKLTKSILLLLFCRITEYSNQIFH